MSTCMLTFWLSPRRRARGPDNSPRENTPRRRAAHQAQNKQNPCTGGYTVATRPPETTKPTQVAWAKLLI
jgi:hypothetical protein